MDAENIKNTPLYNEHIKLNALMAPFAGFNMPIHYGSIIEEAKHTRSSVSVFDISHMGELFVKENPAESSLERIITVPVTKMKNGRCRYGFLLNEKGGVIDDLIVYRIADDEWMIVINASNEERDALEISTRLSAKAKFENRSDKIVKLDVQGPASRDAMVKLAGDGIKQLSYFSFAEFELYGEQCFISRTGYTGELGYEIYTSNENGVKAWQDLLGKYGVKPAGLGARDILRLEMGYPLYSDEMTEETNPIEAGFERVLDFTKEFTGKKALEAVRAKGTGRKLVGLSAEGRRTPRHGSKVLIAGKEAGFITSGVFSPHIERGIAMAYIKEEHSATGTKVEIDAGKGTFTAAVTAMPFLSKTSLKD